MKLVLAGAAGTLAATAAIVVALVAAVGWGNFAALRFFPLPAPSGPLPVGTRACAVAGGIPVQIWYPAATRSGARAPYEYGVAKPSLRARLIAGSVRTDAFLDAPIAGGKHALLLYVPSWGGLRTDNTAQAQNLASYGFIVVAMDDLYPEQPMDFSTASAYRRTLSWADEKARLETAAALRVLDSIEHAGTNDPAGILAGHIAADRIGMFGYSFGGAVAAQAATSDSRIRAAANLDGWIFADAAARGVPRPFLIIANGGDDSGNDASADSSTPYSRKLDATNLEQILDGLQRHGGFLLSISGVEHDSFSDFFFIPSIHRRDHGALDPQRTQTLIATYLVAFFDRYLNDRSGPLLEVSGTGSGHRIVKTIDPAARLDIWQVSRTSFAPVMPSAGSLGRAAGIGKTPLRPITSG